MTGKTAVTFLTVLWMILIFFMSAADSKKSSAQSGRICTIICETFVDGYSEMQEEEQKLIREAISFPVRKCAHLTEYTVLGFLLLFTVTAWRDEGGGGKKEEVRPGRWKNQQTAFLIGALYAAGDELHQLFVPGRAGQPRDILIDSAGVFLGVMIASRTVHLARRFFHQRLFTGKKQAAA